MIKFWFDVDKLISFIDPSAEIPKSQKLIKAVDAESVIIEVEALRDALSSIYDVDSIKSETDDGEVEWWLSQNEVGLNVDEAIARAEKFLKELSE
jgi:hypothetical protein